MRFFVKFLIAACSFLFFSFHYPEAKAQTFKHIDQFSSDKYYVAFINGTGALKDSICSQGLCVAYQFNEGFDACFSIMRNYDIAPQDYNFMPNRFTLSLRGGNKSDRLSFRLWEDINGNRKLDERDEVYVSKSYYLGDTTWHTFQFPVDSFLKIAGAGNHQLDLNRIRAWDIEVENQSDAVHSGEIFINDLRFYSNYKPKVSKQAKLTGTFVTMSNADTSKNGYWTQEKWVDQLQKMKAMNISKIIVQYSIHQNRAWYSPSELSFVNYKEMALNKLFVAAEIVGIQVYLGLTFNETWYKSDKALENTYSDLLSKNKETIDDLYKNFGSSAAFKGWYIPQEINDYDWQTEDKKVLLFTWLQQVAKYAHQKDATKPVMIAPYFNLWQPADLIEKWYNDLLDIAIDIDWIYPQDGIGTSLKAVHIDIPNYGSHIQKACLKHGKKFGLIVESFRQRTGWPIDQGVFTATPTNINQLDDQIQEAYQLNASDIVLFEWGYLQL